MTTEDGSGQRPRLPPLRAAWPLDAIEWWDEKAGQVLADRGCSRLEAELAATEITRAQWRPAPLAHPALGCFAWESRSAK